MKVAFARLHSSLRGHGVWFVSVAMAALFVMPALHAQEPAPAPTPAPEAESPTPAPAPAPAPTPAPEEAAPKQPEATPEPTRPAPAPTPTPATPTPSPAPEEAAPKPQPAPAPRPEPAAAPEPEQPAATPAPAALTPAPDSGMADTLPSFDRDLLPEYDKVRKPPAFFPHMQDDGTVAEPQDNNAGTDAADSSGDAAARGDSDADDGPGWFSEFFDSVFADRTVRNGIIVVTLIVVFIIFRLRNGRKGYA